MPHKSLVEVEVVVVVEEVGMKVVEVVGVVG
jgi:hypothetical protein